MPHAVAEAAGATTMPPRRVATVAVAGVVAGVLLGALDLLAQRHFAHPWADLANSPAVWGLAAYLLGVRVARQVPAALAAVVMLVIAVFTYYFAAGAVLGDRFVNALSDPAVFWYFGAVGMGALGGWTGSWLRSPSSGRAALGAAFAPALAAAEASVQWTGGVRSAGLLLGLVAVLSAAATGGWVRRRHDTRTLLAAAAAAVALAVVGHVAYLAVGLHGFRA